MTQASSKTTSKDSDNQDSRKHSIIEEFKEFINRGNVVDLAVGVAVGGAFTSIAKSLVDDIIMPITSLLAGGLDFTSLSIDIPNIFGADTVAHIAYGNFIQNIVNFLIIAFTVFIIVRAFNRLNRIKEKEEKALAEKITRTEAKLTQEAVTKAIKDANAKPSSKTSKK